MRLNSAKAFAQELISERDRRGVTKWLCNAGGWQFWFDDGSVGKLAKGIDGQYHFSKTAGARGQVPRGDWER